MIPIFCVIYAKHYLKNCNNPVGEQRAANNSEHTTNNSKIKLVILIIFMQTICSLVAGIVYRQKYKNLAISIKAFRLPFIVSFYSSIWKAFHCRQVNLSSKFIDLRPEIFFTKRSITLTTGQCKRSQCTNFGKLTRVGTRFVYICNSLLIIKENLISSEI